jgi:hypothetical protein
MSVPSPIATIQLNKQQTLATSSYDPVTGKKSD